MQIDEKYELLEPLAGVGGASDVTIPAWERSSGRLVFVHILTGGYAAETSQVLYTIGRLAPEHKQHILGAGDLSGSAYVVTDALPWGATLRAWLVSLGGNSPQLERPSEEPRLTRAGVWKIPVTKPTSPPPATNPPAQAEPGGSTGLSAGLQVNPPEASSGSESRRLPVSAPTDSDTAAGKPGEFTQFLQTANLTPASASGSATRPASGTRPAVEQESATARPDPAPLPVVPPTADTGSVQPGEFTQFLKAAKLAPEAPSGSSASASTGIYAAAREQPPAAQPASQPASQPAPFTSATDDPAPKNPGEFTQFLMAANLAPKASSGAGATAPSAPQAAGAPASRDFTPPVGTGKSGEDDNAQSRTVPIKAEARPAPGPSEFTQMMQVGGPPPPGPGSAALRVAEVDADETEEMEAPIPTHGDETATTPAPDQPAPLAGRLGDTRLMQTYKLPASPSQPPVPPPADAGEFTLLFRTDPPAPTQTSQFPASSSSAKPAPPVQESPWRFDADLPPQTSRPETSRPGEFTGLFDVPAPAPSNLPVLPPKPAGEGEFTRMMRAPVLPAGDLFKPPPPPAADQWAVRGGEVQRDEFSHLTESAQAKQPLPDAGANAKAAPAQNRKTSNLPIILILVGLLVLAIVLVVIFAMMR